MNTPIETGPAGSGQVVDRVRDGMRGIGVGSVAIDVVPLGERRGLPPVGEEWSMAVARALAEGRPIIITIDGPAGTGKTAVAQRLAKRLGLSILDTGAMYRAAALVAIEQGIGIGEPGRIVDAVSRCGLRVEFGDDPPTIHASGRDVSDRIREHDVTQLVAPVSAIVPLRDLMISMQRQIATEHPRLVTEGRDQGTEVFPYAAVKFFLTASSEVRALRRAAQIKKKTGVTPNLEELRKEIEIRDEIDRNKPRGALKPAVDSIIVDTSRMDEDAVVGELQKLAMAAVAAMLDGRKQRA
ncbi:MAG: (d)CMP kinase [Planctomycetes bacterium]|nr:(d)CMP kinase [Planctomycetota bacterium]